MTAIPFNIGKYIFGIDGKDGVEFLMPIYVWHHWPLKTSNDNGLLWLRNSFFHKFYNVSWHSTRHFPQFTSLRYRAMQAVCENDIEKLEACIAQGWDPNATIDHMSRFNAVSLAAHLDQLEVLHCLDLHGADLSLGAGKFNNTPLMTALQRWNVRIIDYLMERGADPTVKDSFGFTAKRKAQIKNLRTISSMLEAYEGRFTTAQPASYLSPITNQKWQGNFGHYYSQDSRPAEASAAEKRKQARRQRRNAVKQGATDKASAHPTQYQIVQIRPLQNEISTFKPSELLQEGEYPFSDFYQNSVVMSFVANFYFFRSTDVKQVA